MLRIYGNLSDKHDPHSICPQRVSSEVYLKLGTPPASKSPASKMELKAHVHQRKTKSLTRSTWTRGPSPRNRGPRWPWSEDKRHLGGPKNLIAVEARGTNNICSHPIYWKEQMSWAKIVIFSKVARGSNTKYAILLFVEYRTFWEDQMDPKSVVPLTMFHLSYPWKQYLLDWCGFGRLKFSFTCYDSLTYLSRQLFWQ